MSVRQLFARVALLSVALIPHAACGQPPLVSRTVADSAPPPIPREMRAAWVATVGNMDWPSKPGLTSEQQQTELRAMFDKLVQLHMNAVVLQVRPAADALYASALEPWSDVLTGQMGRAPSPYYDPLAFAVEEAHKRGLELHAWINPYRAKNSSTKTMSPTHVSRTHPEYVRKYGPFLWMDPGDPAVRARTIAVVVDIVRRYDVDAIHMDDYFYPYPETERRRELPFPDAPTWRRYQASGGRLSRDDWRRQNVDLLVRDLGDSIHAAKPWVRFGVSPFGIWRPGNPPSVRGLDQYDKLYADARKWLHEGWVDYFTPQLYWAVDRPEQSYPVLLRWWAEQNVHGRNLWPGNYTGKVGFTNSQRWPASEVIEQIRLTRAQPGATGNVHFNMSVFMQDPDALDERLVHDVYTSPALVPASPWLDARMPAPPRASLRKDAATGWYLLDVTAGPSGPESPVVAPSAPWQFVVQTRTANGWITEIVPASERLHPLGSRGAAPLDVRVTAVDRVGNAGPPMRLALPQP